MPAADYSMGPERYEKLQRLLSDQKSIALEIDNQLKQFEQLQSVLSGQSKISLELDRQLPEKSGPFQALVKIAPETLGDTLLVLVKKIISGGKTPAIVLTTKNYKLMSSVLMEAGINSEKVFMIDCVTKNIFNEKDKRNVVFVDSLEDFPQLGIKIINLFESRSDIVFIFDSLDIMSFYHSNESIFKFVHSMTKILRKNSAAGYYLFGSNSLAPQLSQFFDYAAEIGL